jgi:hypothetical protein
MVIQIRMSAAEACARTIRDLGLKKTIPAGAGIPEEERTLGHILSKQYYHESKNRYYKRERLKIKDGRKAPWK